MVLLPKIEKQKASKISTANVVGQKKDKVFQFVDNRAKTKQQQHIINKLQAPKLVENVFNNSLPIQRVLDVDAVYDSLDRVSGGQYKEEVTQLAALVASYNETHDTEANSKEEIHGQIAKLDAVERKAHELLKRPALPKIARQRLFTFLDATQQQHIDLTDRTITHKLPVHLPENLSFIEHHETQALWKSLTGQNKAKGNIRLHTKNEDFKKQTHSDFAKLLQGSHGRKLLKELNKKGKRRSKRGVDKRIYISDDVTTNFAGSGANLDKDGSYAEPYARAHGKGDLHSEQGNGMANKGTGAYVQIDKKDEGRTMDERSTGEAGEAIYTPTFVTLGHELGHAEAHLKGRTQSTLAEGNDYESQVWTNPEEKRNITHVENKIRDEHGIAKRKYHHSKGAARSVKFRIQFEAELKAIWEQLVVPNVNPARKINSVVNFGTIIKEITTQSDFSDPKVVKAMKKKIQETRKKVNQYIKNPPPEPQPVQQPAPQTPGFFKSIYNKFFGS